MMEAGGRRPLLRAEAPGYIAMIAFLFAYLLNTMGAAGGTQTALNLAGAGFGALYLYRKHALPSMISNVAWGLITIAGWLIR